jgi:hypothetical protein
MSLTNKEKIARQVKRAEFIELDEKFMEIRPLVMGVGPKWREYHNALKAHNTFHRYAIPAKDWEVALHDYYTRLKPFYPQLKFSYED